MRLTAFSASRLAVIAALVFAGAPPLFADESEAGPLEKAIAAADQADAREADAKKVAEKRAAAAEKAASVVEAAQGLVAAAKASVEAADGEASQTAARKALTSAESALKAAQQANQAAQQAKAAAEKDLAKKTAAAREARRKASAEKAWAARQTVAKRRQAIDKARKELQKKAQAAEKAAQQAASAQQAADKAEAARAAAEKTLKTKAEAAKKAAEKARAEKDASQKQKLQKAAEKAEQERVAAEKTLKEKAAAAQQAAKQAAQAKEATKKAKDARAAAEKALRTKQDALTEARDDAALAEAKALGGLTPITSGQWDYAKARHLLSRAGFGGSPEQVKRLHEMGLHGAVDYLVNYHQHPPANIGIDITPEGRRLAYERRLHNEASRRIRIQHRNEHRRQLAPLRRWWLRRMVESPRPLQEKLSLFWHDHFAVQYRTLYDVYVLYQQNEMFRRYADQYAALLHGIVHDPAMIRYLDNHVNRKGNVNENLGREVLELFSMGEENSAEHRPDGYTEEDVRDANTRALTGFTLDRRTGQFRFRETWHDFDEKTLLGKTGRFGADGAIDIILDHPATAEYISKKLYEYFAHRNPDPQVVKRLAHVLKENDYRLRPMLENLFLSEEFYSPQATANRIKSPVELMVGTAKILELESPDYAYIDGACQNMGQTLFEPPDVAGWRGGRAWITAERVISRYNHVADLVERRNQVDLVAALDGQQFTSAAEVVDHLARRCLTAELADEKRQALIEFLGDLPPSAEWSKQRGQINAKLRAVLVMLMSLPEYQVS